jgi:predicted GH43/DUF377 family glycosyl hydrolase
VTDLAERTGLHLEPDASRVVARLFVPGQEVVAGSESRASGVVRRLLALDEQAVEDRLDELIERFGLRHRDLAATFGHHAECIANRLGPDDELTQARWLLLGAAFTHEYSVEAASICNPSMVPHPDQRSAPPGGLRFVMSVRCIGEGHRSSIGFRTGTITGDGQVSIDEPDPFLESGAPHQPTLSAAAFHDRLADLEADGESAAYVLDHLGSEFTQGDLEARIVLLEGQLATRRNAHRTASQLRAIASSSYRTRFPSELDVSGRVLWPATEAESHGVEDARFVRFTDDDGEVTYLATYTAFDGFEVTQAILQTDEFVDFSSSPMRGRAAANKGLALFPRRVGGRYLALSRHDRETNAIASSDRLGHWDRVEMVQAPEHDWEVIQLGNCGPPIETDRGWLVLTHGVGPMRTYSIGALLLDLDDPTEVVGRLRSPLLTPSVEEQDGYVPNVVYSCGSLLHGETLVVPYGIADTSIGVATARLPDLLAAMD